MFARTVLLSLRSSFWFVPSLLVLAGLVGAVGLVALDTVVDRRIVPTWSPLLSAGPEGARQILSAVATSLITTAGVVFSITIVTLSLASNQYSPRVLRSFMRDRLNQLVLGVFVGGFTYCIVVLQAVRSDEHPFVPQLALWGGMLIALVGIGSLVAFIHHTAVSIQASEIVARIAHETVQALEALEARVQPEHHHRGYLAPDSTGWSEVLSCRSGYIQDVDVAGLLRWAARHDSRITLRRTVGDFVIAGRPLLAVASPEGLGARATRRLRGHFGISTYRTIEQDPEFGVRQIVDIALKALSPSLNDTTTAVQCVDYLEVILQAAAKIAPVPDEQGERGQVRLVMKQPGVVRLLEVAVNEIRQNARSNVAVTLRLAKFLGELLDESSDDALWAAVRRQAGIIASAAADAIPAAADRTEVERRLMPLLERCHARALSHQA